MVKYDRRFKVHTCAHLSVQCNDITTYILLYRLPSVTCSCLLKMFILLEERRYRIFRFLLLLLLFLSMIITNSQHHIESLTLLLLLLLFLLVLVGEKGSAQGSVCGGCEEKATSWCHFRGVTKVRQNSLHVSLSLCDYMLCMFVYKSSVLFSLTQPIPRWLLYSPHTRWLWLSVVHGTEDRVPHSSQWEVQGTHPESAEIYL